MRARGARVTDIAVIVVAADDGVKPQTDEAIDHARAADVPIIVAVNKIDKEGADPTRVRTEMTQRGLQPAEWGGEVEFVDVSARTKEGLEDLLETIQVVAELEELRANPNAEASGAVIESRLDPGRGPVVTLLVQRGTLHVGDALVAGAQLRPRARDVRLPRRARASAATPGEPVEVLGFDGVPEAGEYARVVENERRARQLASERANRLKTEALARRSGRKVSLEDVFRLAQEGAVKELNLVLKGDVSGSVEAVEDEIAKLPQDEVAVNIIHRGVGGINESDVMLAAASDAVILAFNVRPVGDARALAEREGIEIRSYSVIYRAIDELRAAMQGMLEPEEVEETIGQAEVRQTFRASRIGTIAGCFVTEGKVTRGAKVRVVRDAHGDQRDDDREPAPLQRGRPRGRRRLRVRHRAARTSRTSRRATCSRPTRRARSSVSSPEPWPRRGRRGLRWPPSACAASTRRSARSSPTRSPGSWRTRASAS